MLPQLNDGEKKDLHDAMDYLVAERGWTMSALCRRLGYNNPSALSGYRQKNKGMSRERYDGVMRLFADGARPEDVGEETGRPEESAERTRRAKILLDSMKARDMNKAQIATSIGYSSYNSMQSSINSGHMGVRPYEKLVQLAGEVLNSKKNGRHAAPSRSTLQNCEEEVKQPAAPDIPHAATIFDYLMRARFELQAVVTTYRRALENAANPLTAPGIKLYSRRVEDMMKEIDDVLAIR